MLNRNLLRTFGLSSKVPQFSFSRYKIRTEKKKIKKNDMTKETIADDKFIKLTTKDEATSKIGQLAKLRDQNVKLLPQHHKSLDVELNPGVLQEFERLRINSNIDVYEEPLTLYSFLKEAQLTQMNYKKDKSVDFVYDDDITKLIGKTLGEIKEETDYFNVERQINEKFDIQVDL